MAAPGRAYHLHHWLQALLALWILVIPASDAQAWPWGGGGSGDGDRSAGIISVSSPSGRLQEVSPPGAVQQLQAALSGHTPRLELISPSDGSLLKTGTVQLTLRIEDWPLAEDPQLGLGAHVALQVDNDPPLRFSHADNDRLQITLPNLSPGSHRLTAYAAMPWGEAVKSQGASLQWRLDLLQPLAGTQPDQDAPWLAAVSPSDLNSGAPLLIDWLIWNAPLQNLREGDGRWRLRISVNGDSFLVDRQEALWLKAAGNGISSVQMELLDGLGDPITPVFNNQLRATKAQAGARPIWMQSRLSDEQMARLLGEAIPEPETQPEEASDREAASADIQQADRPTEQDDEQEDETNAQRPADKNQTLDSDPVDGASPPTATNQELPGVADEAVTDEALTDEAVTDEALADQADEPLQISGAEKAVPEPTKPEIAPAAEPEKLRITSSLGGSARELLNEDGTQR